MKLQKCGSNNPVDKKKLEKVRLDYTILQRRIPAYLSYSL